jgi:hypothetical protein
MGTLLRNSPVDNTSLGDALVKLSEALRKHRYESLNEFWDSFGVRRYPAVRNKAAKMSILLNVDVASLDLMKVKELVRHKEMSKSDLVELGTKRFGIPEGSLKRLRKDAAIETIEAAIRNSEVLDVISEEARREGFRRSV